MKLTAIMEPCPILENLTFSSNWNNKLHPDGTAFSTIRLKRSWNVGTEVNVYLNNVFVGTALCCSKADRKLHQLTDGLCYLDTGYNAIETRNILRTMYKNANVDWNEQPLYIYVFNWTSKHPNFKPLNQPSTNVNQE